MVRMASHLRLPSPETRTGYGIPRIHRAPLFLVRETAPVYDDTPPAHQCLGADAKPSTTDPLSGADAKPSTTDPFTDADALEELEEELVALAAHIHAATHRLLTLIAEFDRRRGWELAGHRSAAHWLSFRTGIDLGTAREKVRAARALEDLPQTSASMARGELSFSKVRALTRVATPENEADLVELARGTTTAQLERMVRAFRKGTREEEMDWERERHRQRSFSVFPDDDGMYRVKGRLTPEVGALLMRAVEAASDALFREEMEGGRENVSAETSGPNPDSETRAARRRADAVGLLAERAMESCFEKGPISGTRAARYQVVLHVDTETLETPAEERAADGSCARSELEDGTRVSAETSRRISCDAGVVRVRHAPDGSILDVGRKTRSIPPALRRALEVRDRGCRFPGCGSRFTDAHHVRHWADGGETSLENCLLLCHHHHRLVHEGGWTVDWWGSGRPVFFDPRGGTHFEGRWRAPKVMKDVSAETLVRDNRARGVTPDGWTPSARWKREVDIPDELLFRAEEAVWVG
jgi:hypothetical protein